MPDLRLYRVTFDRIGRHHHVEPLNVIAETSSDVVNQVLQYARPKLFSQCVRVGVDLGEMRGRITVGEGPGHPVGDFTIEQIDQPAVGQPASQGVVAGATAP
jgi:hypothetical protein